MTKGKLLNLLVQEIRRRNYSYSTEKTYRQWVIRYVRYHNMNHPNALGADDIVAYLNHLANIENVAASTQNQALSALIFNTNQNIHQNRCDKRGLKLQLYSAHYPAPRHRGTKDFLVLRVGQVHYAHINCSG